MWLLRSTMGVTPIAAGVVGLLLLAWYGQPSHGFCTSQQQQQRQYDCVVTTTPTTTITATAMAFRRRASSPLFLAGFGSSGSSSSGSGGGSSTNKDKKLKPKQQWDRYTALKQETKVRVAVRVAKVEKGEGAAADNNNNNNEQEEAAAGEWLDVGRVKSKDNAMTEMAVAQQRGLIVDHARRLFPLQISIKDKIEWAYWRDDADDWVLVDPKQPMELPAQWDKLIGFEGRPDPASGYYCFYSEGRLVNDESEVDAPSKRKVK